MMLSSQKARGKSFTSVNLITSPAREMTKLKRGADTSAFSRSIDKNRLPIRFNSHWPREKKGEPVSALFVCRILVARTSKYANASAHNNDKTQKPAAETQRKLDVRVGGNS